MYMFYVLMKAKKNINVIKSYSNLFKNFKNRKTT
jgi:hypothetical protein